MRTIWNGSISFGLVNIPIGLALATQRSDIAFRTLHRECGTPIKQKRYCPFHERDVEADELVKGWEVAKGEFVIVEESDLEAVALQRSQSIEILRFVALQDVDPVYFDRTYYLAPAGAEAARRPYVLLLRAMTETGMAAIGKFVLWGKENLCLIRPHGDTLALETLFFAEDVRSRAEIEEADAVARDRGGRTHTGSGDLLQRGEEPRFLGGDAGTSAGDVGWANAHPGGTGPGTAPRVAFCLACDRQTRASCHPGRSRSLRRHCGQKENSSQVEEGSRR